VGDRSSSLLTRRRGTLATFGILFCNFKVVTAAQLIAGREASIHKHFYLDAAVL
jgi:hypothetical protein